MTATDDPNEDGTARLQAEAVTDEGALDKLMARGNLTAAPAAVAAHITDWEGLTPAEETEARRKDTHEREEYAREMEQVHERAEELRERLNEQELEIRHKIAEADSRAIVLADGRRVLVGKNGDYIDEASGRKLDGDDKSEAAGKRQGNSETEEEHTRLKEALAKNLEAKDRVIEAAALSSQSSASLTPDQRKQQAARAEDDLAMAQAVTAREDHFATTAQTDLGSTDALSALGLGNDKAATRSPSFAATLDGKDSRAVAMRGDFTASVQPGIVATAKTADPAASSGMKARTVSPA